MSFRDAIDEVMDITRRVDKLELTQNRINATVRKFSGLGRFPRNLLEFTEPNNSNSGVVTISIPDRFQAVSYIRPASCSDNLSSINPQTSYEGVFGYYVTGNNILVRHPHNEDDLYYGLYIHPSILVKDADTNWILDTFFEIIVEMVSAKVQGILGNEAAANKLLNYSREFLIAEVSNYLSPYGD